MGLLQWLFCGPPCNTWSSARFLPPPAPVPVRSREHLYGLPTLSEKLQRQVSVAYTLLLRFLGLCRAVSLFGCSFGLEYPEDRGRSPYPSLFLTSAVLELQEEFDCELVCLGKVPWDH